MQHCGFDLAKTASQLCIRTEDGQLVERRIKTTREELTKFFAAQPRTRILIEAATESEWVAQHLESLGQEVVVADPNFAPMYATLSKKIKTDKRDARALCDACARGTYRRAYRSTAAQRQVRAELIARETLVATRTKYISVIRSLLRREGFRVQSCGAQYFHAHVEALNLPAHLRSAIAPLLTILSSLGEQISQADEQLAEVSKSEPLIKRLCLIPGVGPVTSITFVAILGEARRFASAKQVRAYLGLVPQEESSGEHQRRGHITKAGNRAGAESAGGGGVVNPIEQKGRVAGAEAVGDAHRRAARQAHRGGGVGAQVSRHPLRDVARWERVRPSAATSAGR